MLLWAASGVQLNTSQDPFKTEASHGFMNFSEQKELLQNSYKSIHINYGEKWLKWFPSDKWL